MEDLTEKKKNTKKLICKIATVIGVLLVLVLVFLRFHGLTVKIEKTVTAVDSVTIDGKTEEHEVQVNIKGEYTYFFGTKNRYSGKIKIENYADTDGDVDFRIEDNAPLIYRKNNHAELNSHSFGVISVKKRFSEFEILVDDGEGIDLNATKHSIYVK